MALGLAKSKAATRLQELERTSSLNKFAICDECGRREPNKSDLAKHLQTCVASRACSWCNMVFRNRGNLFSHITRIHSNKNSEKTTARTVEANYRCTVCPKAYAQQQNLKYHIRRDHFNMVTRISEGEKRGLNEVWLERVLNCDAVVEMKKAKLNMFLIKKASSNHTLQISEPNVSIDLTPLYPTHYRKHKFWCNVCQNTYYHWDYDKHIRGQHEKISA